MIVAYHNPDPAEGKQATTAVIHAPKEGVPTTLSELRQLGRTPNKRARDTLAYLDRPGTSNEPTEAINDRLEHLRGSTLSFRNPTSYITRSLPETSGPRPRLHPELG